jgi:hypothetical protein
MKRLSIFLSQDEIRVRYAKWSTALVTIYIAGIMVAYSTNLLHR